MTALVDGAVVSIGSREFSWVEDVDDEGRRSGWYECHRCERTVHGGDDSLAAHQCPKACPACGYIPAPDEDGLATETAYDNGVTYPIWSCCGRLVVSA